MFRRRPSKQYCSDVGTEFSAAANVLLLGAPVYLLQISDRVPPSANYPTLTALTGGAIFLPDCFRLLDWMRQRMIRTPPERRGAVWNSCLPSEGQGERLPWSDPGARGNFSNRATPLLDFEFVV